MAESKCPVCGFSLGFQPWEANIASHEICPCCGIHFGYDDAAAGSIEKRNDIWNSWRNDWITNGMRWWSKNSPPTDWDPNEQLRDLA